MIPVYLLSCILLVAACERLHIFPMTGTMIRELRSAFGVLRDGTLSDDQKEQAVQSASIAVLRTTVKLTLALILTFAAGALPVVIAVEAGWMTYTSFLVFSIQPWVLIATIAGFAAVPWAYARLRSQMSQDAV